MSYIKMFSVFVFFMGFMESQTNIEYHFVALDSSFEYSALLLFNNKSKTVNGGSCGLNSSKGGP